MLDKMYKNLPHIYKRKPNQFLNIILSAISKIFNDFEQDYSKIIASCSIITAEGFWLDFWGFLFKIKRFIDENDNNYRKRILLFVKYGATTKFALLNNISFYYGSEIELVENNGEVIQNYDYLDYNYNFDSCIIVLKYTPEFVSNVEKTFFVNKSYIGSNSYLLRSEYRYTAYQIRDIIGDLKVAGVKLVHDLS